LQRGRPLSIGWIVGSTGGREHRHASALVGLAEHEVQVGRVEVHVCDAQQAEPVRYKDHDGYVKAGREGRQGLAKDRLLLPDDVQRYIDAAQASSVLR